MPCGIGRYAAEKVLASDRRETPCRCVERRRRTREIASGSPPEAMAGQTVADGRASDFSAAHRSCCSSRLSSDWASMLTMRPSEAHDRSPTSITPRTSRSTGTSTYRSQAAGSMPEERLDHLRLDAVVDRGPVFVDAQADVGSSTARSD